VHAISSSEVNDYLRAISGRDITAKDFRTWAGTVKAAAGFAALKGKPRQKSVRAVVADVAEALGNTQAVCRKCYIHPAIFAAYEAGGIRLAPVGTKAGPPRGLSAAERGVLALLKAAAKH
jgi:DNA topoisomerase-1